MNLDEIDTLIAETGKHLGVEPVGTVPHEIRMNEGATPQREDVSIGDPRRYLKSTRVSTPKMSMDDPRYFNLEELQARKQAEDININRMRVEIRKLKREHAVRGGQADPQMFAPLEKRYSRGYKLMQQPPKKPYRTQLIGDRSPTLPKSRSERLADFYGSYIDQPNDPAARGSVRTQQYFDKFDAIADPKTTGYIPNDIGYLQQNPQYRGIRLVLPQSGGSYSGVQGHFGREAMKAGTPRIETEGPVAPPDPNDPHYNPFPRVPITYPPDMGGLREEVYGHLISRGYPVYGGTEDFGGEFPPGFNPVGFGQRDRPVGASALLPRR